MVLDTASLRHLSSSLRPSRDDLETTHRRHARRRYLLERQQVPHRDADIDTGVGDRDGRSERVERDVQLHHHEWSHEVVAGDYVELLHGLA